MKQTNCLLIVGLILLMTLLVISCGKDPVSPSEGPSDAFIQKLIAYLTAYGGATNGLGEGGEPESTGIGGLSFVESLYVDTIDEHGEHLIGYYYYDDGGTPWPDIADDLFGFRGMKIYADNEDTINVPPDSITERIWFEIHVPYTDRRVISVGKNITEGHKDFGDSACLYLDKVDTEGGEQSGEGIFLDYDTGHEFSIGFGLDHNGTPDYWDDNSAWMEFFLIDDNDCQDYLIHLDYESWDVSQLTGHGGSGWVRVDDENGALIATIDFDSTGWGWLTFVMYNLKFRIYVG